MCRTVIDAMPVKRYIKDVNWTPDTRVSGLSATTFRDTQTVPAGAVLPIKHNAYTVKRRKTMARSAPLPDPAAAASGERSTKDSSMELDAHMASMDIDALIAAAEAAVDPAGDDDSVGVGDDCNEGSQERHKINIANDEDDDSSAFTNDLVGKMSLLMNQTTTTTTQYQQQQQPEQQYSNRSVLSAGFDLARIDREDSCTASASMSTNAGMMTTAGGSDQQDDQ